MKSNILLFFIFIGLLIILTNKKKCSKFIYIIIIFVLLFILFSKKSREFIQSSDPVLISIVEDVKKLDPRIKNLQFYSSDEESYTEDKQKVFICLKNEKGEYYDRNMLVYVVIHELAHALTDVIDEFHKTPEFKNKFEELLTKAHRLGFYDPEKPLTKHYCHKHLNVRDMQR
jgi:hypothetical protein